MLLNTSYIDLSIEQKNENRFIHNTKIHFARMLLMKIENKKW